MGMFETVAKAMAPVQDRLFGLLEALLAEVRETNRLLREQADGGDEG